MPIQPMYFQPLSFDQNNPFLTGMKSGQQIVGGTLENKQRSLANQLAQATLPYAAPSAQAQLLAQQLGNQVSQLKMPFVAPQSAADLARTQAQVPLMQAQTGQANAQTGLIGAETAKAKMMVNNPLLNMGGTAGQLGAYLYLLQQGKVPGAGNQQPGATTQPYQMPDYMVPGSQQGAPPLQPGQIAQQQAMQQPQQSSQQDLPNMLMNSLTAGLRKTNAQADYLGKRATGYNYLSLPVDQRDAILAQTSGMGYDPTQASKLLMQGNSLEDLAKAKGFDMNNLPDPIYPTTKSALNQIQRRQQAITEINTLNPILTNAIAPYSQRFAGYSPKQISQAMSGDNPEQQAQYLAAKALMPEMSSLRLKAMGGQVGIEAIREVQHASMANLKSFDALVKPDVYKRANELIDQWIMQGSSAANKTGLRTYGTQNQNSGAQNGINPSMLTQENLEHTAKKYNMTVDQVKQKLGVP